MKFQRDRIGVGGSVPGAPGVGVGGMGVPPDGAVGKALRWRGGAPVWEDDSDLFVPVGDDIQAAIDTAAGAKRIVLAPGTHSVTATLLMRAAHTNLHIEALVPGKTTLKIDDAAFPTTAALILRNEVPTPKYSETGRVDVVTAGATVVPVASTTNIAPGDLVLMRRTTTGFGLQGEIRRVLRTTASNVTLDMPLYRNSLNGASWQFQVFAPRTATIRGIVFDTAPMAAGHAGAMLVHMTNVLFEDCRFIGGGAHGAYVFSSHTVRYRRCHAEDMVVRAAAWTPERTGYTSIPAGRTDLAGEGYGLGFEAVNGIAEDCTFRHNRHHLAAGGLDYCNAHLLYTNCHGTEDLQGAYDFHENTDYAVIDEACSATRGWAGGWIRGRHIKVRGDYTDMASDAVRLLGEPEDIDIDVTSKYCAYHVRLVPDAASVRGVKVRGRALTCTTMALWTAPAKTYTDIDIELDIQGGKWQAQLQGTFRNLRLRGVWRGPSAYAGAQGSDTAPVWIRADNVLGAVKNLAIEKMRVLTEGLALGTTIILDRAATATSLADGTYADVVIEDVALDTAGGASYGVVGVGNNAGATRSVITGRERIVNIWRNNAPSGPQTAGAGRTTVADGATITHGLARTPTKYGATGAVAGEIVSITAASATTLTVAIKTTAGAAGTSQAVAWWAEL